MSKIKFQRKDKYHFDIKCLSKLQQKPKRKFLSENNINKNIIVFDKNYQFKDNKKKNGIKAISIFSGAGGLDIGAELAGVKVLSCLDFDKDSISTLKLNTIFQGKKIFLEDIRGFKLKEYNQIINNEDLDKLIVIGGPPCQPFSKAGYWVTHENRLGKNDPRNMISEFLNFIKQLKPDGFILENVESILHPKNKNIRDEIESFMSKNHYNSLIYNADATNFGVAQKRKRVFFIASKNKIIGEPKKKNNENSKTSERVIDWIYKFDQPRFFEESESVLGKTYEKEIYQIPPGKNYFALTSRDNYPKPVFEANKRFWSFLLKLDPFLPSWTIPAQPGPWVGPFHWNNRRLRAREIASIQTFPENYQFFGNRRSIQKQIGNAVPPLLGKAMVEFLINHL